MVRPASFGANPQTAPSNRFQSVDPPRNAAGAAAQARVEFDRLAAALDEAGVRVHAFDDLAAPACPDAVFPNNWVSLHADGTVVLYPMLAPNRRGERRLDLLAELERLGGYRVERLLDLTWHELEGRYLEGTGSVVFDHAARLAYACRSPRTDLRVLDELCAELGYEAVPITGTDRDGVPVYHTNVMLAIGSGFALVCTEAVAPAERGGLLERLGAGGRRLIEIDHARMGNFAGNVLELRDARGTRVLAASQRAFDSLASDARAALEAAVDRCVVVPVPTIETLGGGSVRCMLAEVFLPPVASADLG